MRNIIVLTASPRKSGNSDMLADSFIKGATDAGNSVVKFETAFKPVKPCLACNACFSNGEPCPLDPNFNELAKHLEAADTIVFATPLYWFSFPAQLKSVIDKFYSFSNTNHTLKIKSCAMIVCAETDDEDEFEGIVSTYKLIAEYQKWEDLGTLKIPAVSDKGDVLHTEGIAKAHEFGLSF